MKYNNLKLNYSFKDKKIGDIESSYADVTKIKKTIGWESKISIKRMLSIYGFNPIRVLLMKIKYIQTLILAKLFVSVATLIFFQYFMGWDMFTIQISIKHTIIVLKTQL